MNSTTIHLSHTKSEISHSKTGSSGLIIAKGLFFAAIAISGLLSIKVWAGLPLPNIPSLLVIVAVLFALPGITRSETSHSDHSHPFFVYVLILLGYGTIWMVLESINHPFAKWKEDLQAVEMFFGSFYLCFAFERDDHFVDQVLLLFFFCYFAGALVNFAETANTVGLDLFLRGIRFGADETTGFLDNFKLGFTSILIPYVFFRGFYWADRRQGTILILCSLAVFPFIFLWQGRTGFFAPILGILLVPLYLRMRGQSIPSQIRWRLGCGIIVLVAIILVFGIFFSNLPVPGLAENIGQVVSNFFERFKYEFGDSNDTAVRRIEEVVYMLGELSPVELIMGRGVGSVYQSGELFAEWYQRSGRQLTEYYTWGSTAVHLNYFTLILKGGIIMVIAVALTFPRYLFLRLERMTEQEVLNYAAVLALIFTILISNFSGATHNLTGGIVLGTALGYCAVLRQRIVSREAENAKRKRNRNGTSIGVSDNCHAQSRALSRSKSVSTVPRRLSQ